MSNDLQIAFLLGSLLVYFYYFGRRAEKRKSSDPSYLNCEHKDKLAELSIAEMWATPGHWALWFFLSYFLFIVIYLNWYL